MAELIKLKALGADPELFIKDLKLGIFVPSIDLIGGNKWVPRPSRRHKGFSIQEDNVLAEYNIPPSKTKIEFRDNIRLGMQIFEEALPPKRYSVEIVSSHKFLPDQLLDPRAEEFGCTPDKNAWLDGIENPAPEVPKDGLRCAGGHVHINYEPTEAMLGVAMSDEDKLQTNQEIVKWLDLLLAVPAMKIDKDTERRRLYGKAGAYRDKSYGLEYRTLSSFWLSSASLIDWVWDKTEEAVKKCGNLELVHNSAMERIMSAINFNDSHAIDSLFEEYNLQTA